MNLNTPNGASAQEVDIDALLQRTYLLVVELRQDGSAQNSLELRACCATQIVEVRGQLECAGVGPRSIDLICYAQCALLDETVLGCATKQAHADWAAMPLQAEFFSRHQAGESLYEDMREVLREPSPDPLVLTVYHRVLALGFKGRYSEHAAPEREQLMEALAQRVRPLTLERRLPTQACAGGRLGLPERWRGPLGHWVLASLLLVGLWWALDLMLGDPLGKLWLSPA